MGTRTPVKNLYCDSVHSLPVSIDWRERLGDDLNGWTYWEAVQCQECDKWLVYSNQFCDEHHCDLDDRTTCQGWVAASEGPQMNYYYPLPGGLRFDAAECARRIRHLPLVLVEIDGDWALALTGGGMDLSWEICEAFMLCGFLPPLHFTDLPRMAGMRLDTRRRWVIAGCRRSAEVAAYQAQRRRKSLRELVSDMRQRAEKAAA